MSLSEFLFHGRDRIAQLGATILCAEFDKEPRAQYAHVGGASSSSSAAWLAPASNGGLVLEWQNSSMRIKCTFPLSHQPSLATLSASCTLVPGAKLAVKIRCPNSRLS